MNPELKRVSDIIEKINKSTTIPQVLKAELTEELTELLAYFAELQHRMDGLDK